MSASEDSDALSVRGSVRKLFAHALANPTDTALDSITRTVKFGVRADERLKRELNRHFDAADAFRRSLATDLERMFEQEPVRFFEMVNASVGKPFEGKSNCYGWLLTKYITGQSRAGVIPDITMAVVAELASTLKSFATRRSNVSTESKTTVESNARLWSVDIPSLVEELSLDDVPPPPSAINLEQPSDSEIDAYNKWVALARMWANLVLIQRHRVPRDEAALPRYLKHFPGFPCSQRFRDRVELDEALHALRDAVESLVERNISQYASISDEEWQAILARFPGPVEGSTGPRTIRASVGRRLYALLKDSPSTPREDLAREIIAGLLRGADKAERHFRKNSVNDRQSVAKLLNILNTAAVFALEPFRVRSDYVALFREDTARRDAYGAARGALHDAGDTSESIQIAGFSIRENGTARYNGFLCHRHIGTVDEWAFAVQLGSIKEMRIAPEESVDPRRRLTGWTALATIGGSRKLAQYKPKEVHRDRLWIPNTEPPIMLPLQLGKRQGREYLWHADRGLKERNGWTLANGRILRICPSGRKDLASFFVVIALEREVPNMAEPLPGKLIGVDRGEAVPATFAVLDSAGRVLERGKIHPEYRDQQRKFASQKSEMQRRYGGYSRWLKAKERNRAKSLSGEVSRNLLDLAAAHLAPLVFERLGSGIATRGGARQLMSLMQYEKVLSTIEQRLAEASCYKTPSAPTYRKTKCGFVGFVGASYTSSTCSDCGQVHSARFYNELAATLSCGEHGAWSVMLGSNRIVLPATYRVWIRARGEVEVSVGERLGEIFRDQNFTALPKTRAAAAIRTLKSSLPYRPSQDQFICLRCGHQDDADLQAAVNIARKFLFLAENPRATSGDSDEGRRSVEPKWQSWYESKCQSWA
jgi:transposase